MLLSTVSQLPIRSLKRVWVEDLDVQSKSRSIFPIHRTSAGCGLLHVTCLVFVTHYDSIPGLRKNALNEL